MEQFNELAVLVVNAIVRDCAQDAFIKATPTQREEIVMAYVASEVIKFSRFADAYHTTPEIKSHFARLVLGA